MSKTEELKIIRYGQTWKPDGIFGRYMSLCFTGLSGGAILGVYMGATLGFTTAALSPVVVGYGLFRVGRKILRR